MACSFCEKPALHRCEYSNCQNVSCITHIRPKKKLETKNYCRDCATFLDFLDTKISDYSEIPSPYWLCANQSFCCCLMIPPEVWSLNERAVTIEQDYKKKNETVSGFTICQK